MKRKDLGLTWRELLNINKEYNKPPVLTVASFSVDSNACSDPSNVRLIPMYVAECINDH